MTVEASIFLFGKPAWEIKDLEGRELDDRLIEEIRFKGKELEESLDRTADILKQLSKRGWTGSGTLYDVSLFKDVSLGVARKELAELGLDPDIAFEIEEDEEEIRSAGIER